MAHYEAGFRSGRGALQDAMVESAPNARVRALERYEVLGRLATGGMAEVELARSAGPDGFEHVVVLKRVLPHLARSAAFVNMFVDEARIMGGLRHPNVVLVYDFVHQGEELFLVLEYVEGESVGGLLRRLWSEGESLDAALAAHIVAEACSALHAAHELRADDGARRNVVHRDVSPQNVMVTYAGEVKLLDFGIATATDRITRTAAGEVKGKYEYMSPEQCRGEPLDRRSDLFSLGVLLFELSTGRRLFKRDNALLTFRAICEDPLPEPELVRAGYPECLAAVLRKALARRPEDRYATALDMRRELVAALRTLAVSAPAEEMLATLLNRLFADRIQQKREMLQCARRGRSVVVPEEEADPGSVIPSALERLPNATSDASTDALRKHQVRGDDGRRPWVLLVFMATVAAVAWQLGRSWAGERANTDRAQAQQVAPPRSITPTPEPASAAPASVASANASAAPAPLAGQRHSFPPRAKPLPRAASAASVASVQAPATTASPPFARWSAFERWQ